MDRGAEQKRAAARMIEIDAEAAGQRIDNYLLTHLKGAPRSLVYRILRSGEVRVNRGRIKPAYRLQAGDQVRIPPLRLAPAVARPAAPSPALARLERRILFEDERLLVLNKPSGMAVHGGSGLSWGVIEALRQLRPTARSLELVHRLDRDTSGCLLVAKRRSMLRALHELLRAGEVEKTYLALVAGPWQGGRRRVDVPLRKNVLRSGERMVQVGDDGKRALSVFEPVAVGEEASLVRVALHTGRTHQIRVHAAHLGQPLAGDEKYGSRAFNRTMRSLGLRRLFLHAAAVAFQLPDAPAPLKISAPLDEDLSAILHELGLDYAP